MAEKTMKLKIEAEGFEPLYKNLNKVNDKTKDFVYNFKEVSEAFKSVLTPASQSLKTLDELMAASVKHIVPDMEKIGRLNEKMLKIEQETNTLRAKNLQTEIAGLDKNKTAITKIYEEYEKKEQEILKKGKERKDNQLKAIDDIILKAKLAGNDITKLEEDRAKAIKDIDNEILKAVKANNNERKEAVTVAVKENVNSIKQMYEKQKALILEASELEKQKVELAHEAAMEQAKTNEERVSLESRKAENIKSINNDLYNKLTENSKAELAATTTFVDSAIKEVTEKVAETKKDKYGITDIAITKEGIAAAKAQLEEYKSMLNDSRNAAQLHFATLESQYKEDASMLKQIQNEKENTMSVYATKIAKIEKDITDTSKKENGLRLQQMKDFAKNTETVINKMKDAVGKATDYLKEGFEAVGKMYENQVNAINEELNILVEKDSEAYAKGKTSMANIAALEKEKTAAKESGNAKAVEEIQKKIDAEEAGATKEIEIAKNRDAKEAELKKEKEKIETRQRKANRLFKRIELVKSIAEATANVAQAVTKTMAAYPFPFNIALAATVGVAGALQIKAMTAQLTKFEDGGLLRGKRHSQGGMRIEGSNIEVEGGEYVVNRESTSRNLGLVRYINSERRELKPADLDSFFSRSSRGFEPAFSRIMQNGGQLPVTEPTNNIDNQTLVQAIRSIRIEPRVAVSDIHRVQDSMVSVDSWTGV